MTEAADIAYPWTTRPPAGWRGSMARAQNRASVMPTSFAGEVFEISRQSILARVLREVVSALVIAGCGAVVVLFAILRHS